MDPEYTKNIAGMERFDIGEYTYGSPDVLVWDDQTHLKIGKFCSISNNVTIILGGERRADWVSTYPFPAFFEEAKNIPGHPFGKGDVIIGNDVWIGFGATILSGVTIGDGAIIGAGAVVRKNVPPYAIVYGNPAIIKRYRFCKHAIDQLLDLQWWEWPIEKIKKNLHFICNQPNECKHY